MLRNHFLLLDENDGDDLRNPDNIATSKKSIMIQEDLNDYNIIDGVNARVLKYNFTNHNLNPVAIVDQSQDISYPKAGEWESSGIIEVFDIFRKGYWLLNIHKPRIEYHSHFDLLYKKTFFNSLILFVIINEDKPHKQPYS